MSDQPFNGRVREIRSCSGARLVAVSHAPDSQIRSHQHDWPHLGIHLAGGCIERFDGVTAPWDGPGAIYHPRSSGHEDQVLPGGLETVGLIFDPHWLPNVEFNRAFARPQAWRGGAVAIMARRLLASWARPNVSDAELQHATEQFFQRVSAVDATDAPAWLDRALSALEGSTSPTTRGIAASLDLHPAWLVRRYRQVTGEGLRETLRRRRVECALALLRASKAPLAEIALRAGFRDQPHMNRCFRHVLGRSPQQCRLDFRSPQPQPLSGADRAGHSRRLP